MRSTKIDMPQFQVPESTSGYALLFIYIIILGMNNNNLHFGESFKPCINITCKQEQEMAQLVIRIFVLFLSAPTFDSTFLIFLYEISKPHLYINPFSVLKLFPN